MKDKPRDKKHQAFNYCINFFTGLAGLIMWYQLTIKSPEYSVRIALGLMAALMGFGGRETIKEIIKIWKGKEQ